MAIAWRSAVTVGIACALRGWLMLFLPYVLIEGLGAGAIVRALLALPVVALASVGFCATQRQLAALPTDAMRWARQAAWSVVGSLIAVLPILALSQR
jgi:hypothetical protein